MTDVESTAFPDDPRTVLTRELIGLQIETWLLEERARLVRAQLQHCRTRRAGLGRQYRRLLRVFAI